jgi:hypothetical protein
MLAVLERAVDDFRTYGMVPTGRGRRLFMNVAGWLGSSATGASDFEASVRRADSIRLHQKGSAELVRRATSAPRFEDRGPAGQCRGAIASVAPCGRASRSPARVTAAATVGPRTSADSRPPSGFRIDRGWAHAHRLADGTDVTVRMLRPEDRAAFLAGFERLSRECRYLSESALERGIGRFRVAVMLPTRRLRPCCTIWMRTPSPSPWTTNIAVYELDVPGVVAEGPGESLLFRIFRLITRVLEIVGAPRLGQHSPASPLRTRAARWCFRPHERPARCERARLPRSVAA